MFRQAVLEEFKTQRIIICYGIAFAVLIYAFFHIGPWHKPDLGFYVFHLVGLLTFFAFASCAGSFAFGRQTNRSRISIFQFLIRLVVATVSTMISAIPVILALSFSIRLDAPNPILDSLYPDFMYFPLITIYFSGAVLIYACSALFALMLNRPWFSALIGFVIGTTVLFSICSFWIRLDFNTWMAKKPVNCTILLSGVLLLAFALGCARRLKPGNPSTRIIVGFVATLAAALVATTLMYLTRPSAAELEIGAPILSPLGTEIVSNAYAEDTYRQIWTIPIDNDKGNRKVKRHAYDPVISPDGRWFAFLSQKGIFGLRSYYVDLRVTAIDGTKEKVVLPRIARWKSNEVSIGVEGKVFSPDNKYIALLCNTVIYVVDLEGNVKAQAPLPPYSDKQILGWRPNHFEVLLADYRGIQIYDVAKRQFKPVYRAKEQPKRLWPINSRAGIRYVVYGNELVDVDRGSAQPFPEKIWWRSLSILTDQSTLIYSINSEEFKPEVSSASVHRFHIQTGRDELFAEFRGVIERLLISPDGNRTAFELQFGSRQLKTLVMEGNSLIRGFDNWGLIGWRDSGEVVLANNNLFPRRMALGNIATGQVRQFYP